MKKCCDREKITACVLYVLCHLGFNIIAIQNQHLTKYMSENRISVIDSRHCMNKARVILDSGSNDIEHISQEVTNILSQRK
jgi:hypothetical protein